MAVQLSEVLAKVVLGEDLSREEAAEAMGAIMGGESSPAVVAGFLVAMRMKGETVAEITGFAETMRQFATPVATHRRPLVDTCGTGGDHSGTFNVSTCAAFVVAGAGVAVAKHGNRSASSRCGSADVLESLGVNIEAGPEVVGKCIDEAGIGFLFARSHHPAMKHVAPVRTELKTRTVFNLLGPLTNPAGADGQLIGVFDNTLIEPLAEVLAGLGIRHGFVVAGSDGLDEITTTGPTNVAETRDGKVKRFAVHPNDFGIRLADPKDLLGGDAPENARILQAILEGEPGPKRDIVVLNAAPALVAGEVAEDLKEGVALAAQAIDSGAALEKLAALKRVSNASAPE